MTSIAICGIGNIGKVHLRNLLTLRGCRIAGVFDRKISESERVGQSFSVPWFTSWEEMLADSGVDAVVIATPAASHREFCCTALDAGKHVFVEKPLANTLEDATAIVQAEANSDRIVQVGFCERFNAAYIEAKRAVAQGQLGSIRAIHSSRTAPYHMADLTWELGVLDTATHNLDLILWLMEVSPNSVLTRGTNVYTDGRIPHTCTTLLSFEGGSMAIDTMAWVREESHPLSECAKSLMFIQGNLGTFRIDHSWRPAWVMDDRQFRAIDTVIIGGPEYYGCLKLQLDHFLRAIAGDTAPAVTAKESFRSELVTLAAFESLKTGREVSLKELR